MDPNIKKQWIEALRSGKYKQGRYWLRHRNEFCCLGVLCDLHAQATNCEWNTDENYLGAAQALPKEVVNWAGLDSEDPFINEERVSSYNDRMKRNFDQIADLIESNL